MHISINTDWGVLKGSRCPGPVSLISNNKEAKHTIWVTRCRKSLWWHADLVASSPGSTLARKGAWSLISHEHSLIRKWINKINHTPMIFCICPMLELKVWVLGYCQRWSVDSTVWHWLWWKRSWTCSVQMPHVGLRSVLLNSGVRQFCKTTLNILTSGKGSLMPFCRCNMVKLYLCRWPLDFGKH